MKQLLLFFVCIVTTSLLPKHYSMNKGLGITRERCGIANYHSLRVRYMNRPCHATLLISHRHPQLWVQQMYRGWSISFVKLTPCTSDCLTDNRLQTMQIIKLILKESGATVTPTAYLFSPFTPCQNSSLFY